MRGFLFICGLFLVFILSCNGAVTIGSPEMTAVFMGSTYLRVFWERNESIENNADFVGYNVYIYTDSIALLVDDGEELNKFNSQVIQDTTFQANGLSQDNIYYVQVRTVNIEDKVNGYNSTTPFLHASPRPEFTVTMRMATESQPVNDSSAIRYGDGFVMVDSSMVDSTADMWVKSSGDTIWFVTPSNHPLYGSGGRETLFSNIGPGDFYTISEVVSEPTSDETEVLTGDIIIARNEDGNYVKLFVGSIDLQNDIIVILYAYQNVTGYPYF